MAESNVLFEIKDEHLDTGLRGIPVGRCTTSFVDPQKGLHYRGYPIAELSDKTSEEAIYLLLKGELPNKSQLDEFNKELMSYSKLDPAVIKALEALPKEGHPMKWFTTGLALIGMSHATGDYRKDWFNVVAKLPELVAAIFRIRSGWGKPIPSRQELRYIKNFAAMLDAPGAPDSLTELLEVFEILHMDHGGGNLSTFVGKAVASGHEDMYGSLMGAMCGLAGPLHGMANQECLRFLKGALKKVSDPADEASVKEFVNDLLNSGGKLYGFGHAVLRVEDPRATVEYKLGEKLVPNDPLFRLAVTLRKVGSEILKSMPKVSNPYPNVDAVSGTLLNALGLEDETYYTVLFGMSRCVGIASQIVYERTEARGGKGTPIVRPKFIYAGPRRG